MRKLNKKGAELAFPIIIFVVLNIAFFSIMFLFVQRVSSNALIYEEAYAKKIGLLLNRAEPGMEITINVEDLAEIAAKNGVINFSSMITIDTEKGIVLVKARPEGGFNFPYFSNITLTADSGEKISKKDNQITQADYIIKIK